VIINVHLICDTLLYMYMYQYESYNYMTIWIIVACLMACLIY